MTNNAILFKKLKPLVGFGFLIEDQVTGIELRQKMS
jgi:hypothetical protein